MARILFINGDIDESMSGSTIAQLLDWREEDLVGNQEEIEPITMYITSHGGELHASKAICEAMNLSLAPIITFGIGYVESGGLLIFLHGEHRMCTQNTHFLQHGMSVASGRRIEHITVAQQIFEQFKEDMEYMKNIEVEKTGLSRGVIDSWWEHHNENRFNAEKALQLGIVHEIV